VGTITNKTNEPKHKKIPIEVITYLRSTGLNNAEIKRRLKQLNKDWECTTSNIFQRLSAHDKSQENKETGVRDWKSNSDSIVDYLCSLIDSKLTVYLEDNASNPKSLAQAEQLSKIKHKLLDGRARRNAKGVEVNITISDQERASLKVLARQYSHDMSGATVDEVHIDIDPSNITAPKVLDVASSSHHE